MVRPRGERGLAALHLLGRKAADSRCVSPRQDAAVADFFSGLADKLPKGWRVASFAADLGHQCGDFGVAGNAYH